MKITTYLLSAKDHETLLGFLEQHTELLPPLWRDLLSDRQEIQASQINSATSETFDNYLKLFKIAEGSPDFNITAKKVTRDV